MSMKKIIPIALSVCLLLTACGSSEPAQPAAASSAAASSVAETQASETIETEKNLLTVEITFPASFFEGEDMSTFDTESYASENGFENAVVNDDGSVTVVMSKSKHKVLMEETKANIEKSLNDMVNAEDTPFIKGIENNNDFTNIKVIVDKEGYENNALFAAFIPLTFYIQTSFYHTVNGTEPILEFSFIDQADNSVIASVLYPDALNESNN